MPLEAYKSKNFPESSRESPRVVWVKSFVPNEIKFIPSLHKSLIISTAAGVSISSKLTALSTGVAPSRMRPYIITVSGETITGGDILVRNGKIAAVNEISLEDYLTSVISSEMHAGAPIEFLKAHAVVSRSWLLAALTGTCPVPLLAGSRLGGKFL